MQLLFDFASKNVVAGGDTVAKLCKVLKEAYRKVCEQNLTTLAQ